MEPIRLLILALFTGGWCVLHSLLIATPVTAALRRRLGSGFRWFRVLYNALAFVTFLLVLAYASRVKGDVWFGWGGSWVVLRVLMLGAALGLFAAGARNYDLLQFLGLRQLASRRTQPGLTSDGSLNTSGVLNYTRHPWYLGALLLIWTRALDASALVVNVVLSVYLIVGSMLEERKLVAEYGETYRRYQQRVPMLVPRLIPRSRRSKD